MGKTVMQVQFTKCQRMNLKERIFKPGVAELLRIHIPFFSCVLTYTLLPSSVMLSTLIPCFSVYLKNIDNYLHDVKVL